MIVEVFQLYFYLHCPVLCLWLSPSSIFLLLLLLMVIVVVLFLLLTSILWSLSVHFLWYFGERERAKNKNITISELKRGWRTSSHTLKKCILSTNDYPGDYLFISSNTWVPLSARNLAVQVRQFILTLPPNISDKTHDVCMMASILVYQRNISLEDVGHRWL